MDKQEKTRPALAALLGSAGSGRRSVQLAPAELFFAQGDPAGSIFYIESGRSRLSVLSSAGKEATVAILSAGDFLGDEALANPPGPRTASAIAVTACAALEIDREEMILLLHRQQQFSDLFLQFLLARRIRVQQDLADHLFNSSEKRLARVLLLMAGYCAEMDRLDASTQPQSASFPAKETIPGISQEVLAEMVGTTRSRVNFFMNRFRRLGLIDYSAGFVEGIRVHRSLLKVISCG